LRGNIIFTVICLSALKSAQFVLFKALNPLLQLSAGKGGVILAPLQRYLQAACCGNNDHISDYNSMDFVVIRVFTFSAGMPSPTVLV
jgi:hypothetical protein